MAKRRVKRKRIVDCHQEKFEEYCTYRVHRSSVINSLLVLTAPHNKEAPLNSNERLYGGLLLKAMIEHKPELLEEIRHSAMTSGSLEGLGLNWVEEMYWEMHGCEHDR